MNHDFPIHFYYCESGISNSISCKARLEFQMPALQMKKLIKKFQSFRFGLDRFN